MRYALVVEYDGTNYHGFQRQNGLPSVQQELEDALSLKLQHGVTVIASGRTDAGVHARGQVVHFDSNVEIDCSDFGWRMNPLLPSDIAIKKCVKVDESFHARFGAKKKTYVYRVYLSKIHSPLKQKYNHVCFYDLDVPLMRQACEYFVGEHDFRSFMLSGAQVRTTVRTIYDMHIEVSEEGRQLDFYYTGNGFLHNMVRAITGTLIDLGRGRFTLEQIPAIIASKKRSDAGKTLEGEVTTVTQIIGTQPSAAEDPTAPAEPEAVTITTTETEINIGGDDLKAGMAAEGLSYTEKAEGNSYIINAFSSTETGFSSTIISFCNIPDSGKVIFSHIVREKAADTSTTTITKGILTVASQG